MSKLQRQHAGNKEVVPNTPAFQSSTFARFVICSMGLVIAALMWRTAGGDQHLTSHQKKFIFSTPVRGEYLLGVGIGDITGPVVETNMMGYASLAQTDAGLHMRQRSRVFIIADPSDPSQRVVYINSDISCGDTAIRRAILTKLEKLYPGMYSDSNVALIGTHTHAGVGGYLNNLLPQFTSIGFVRQAFDAIVDGTLHAISEAHSSMAIGTLSIGNTTVYEGGINRSPSAYLQNPPDERARYDGDVDHEMSLIRFEDNQGKILGFLSFFAVHGTSLYNNNTLISSDNKGYAAYLFESMASPDEMPGMGSFVAGFSQSTSGDISPNTLGAYCQSPGKPWHGLPCDFHKSTCGNRTQDCHGRGPGFRVSDFRSNEIIGERQFEAARTLMKGKSLEQLVGPVKGLHTFVDMSKYTFTLPNGTSVTTCPAALGFSFAGGTTDGPGAFDFVQGITSGHPRNPLWEVFKGAITPQPNAQQIACHHPKPVLLNVGYARRPYEWSPRIVDIQIFRIGQLVILILPGEFTTMSGRRLKEAVRRKLIADGITGEDAYVIAVGPGNTYSHYTTTIEEYSVQRYEGASTLFGPHQLEAYIDLYSNMSGYLHPDNMEEPPRGPIPEDFTQRAVSIRAGVTADGTPLGTYFGSVVRDVQHSYRRGDQVSATFHAANPRNNLKLESTYLAVEYYDPKKKQWNMVRSDSHPSTTFGWTRTNLLLGRSTVNITWTIEDNTPTGNYRLTYYGDSKAWIGNTITPFSGSSSSFTVH